MTTKPPRPPKLVAFPVPVLIDTREQLPYTFAGLRADAKQGGGPLVVEARRATLASGDYSLDGYADRVAVERKSAADAFQTFSRGRDRFERELARLNDLEFAAVVVESEWSEMLASPPTAMLPKTVFRSVIAWQQRYPRVHWWPVPGRAVAEAATLRILERFYRESTRAKT